MKKEIQPSEIQQAKEYLRYNEITTVRINTRNKGISVWLSELLVDFNTEKLKEMTSYRDGLANDYMEHMNQIAKLTTEKRELLKVLKEIYDYTDTDDVEYIIIHKKITKAIEKYENV